MQKVAVRDVRRFAQIVLGGALAACRASGIEPSAHIISVCGWREPDGAGLIRHVRIGDIEGCVSAVLELAGQRGRNVYVSLAVFPQTLAPRTRGKADQAVGVFGLGVDLDADKGCRMRPEDLPLAPAVVLATSVTPEGANRNGIYLLDRLLLIAEAKALAVDLAHMVGDQDGGTADPIHVWRVAGTLNWPKASKLQRGRAPDPQRVAFDLEMPGNATPVSHDLLRAALDVALEGLPYQEVMLHNPGSGPSVASGGNKTDLTPADPNVFDGDPRELARDLEALQHISSDSARTRWRAVLAALYHRYSGSELGEQIARAWSRGGTVGHVAFEGAAHRFTETGFRDHWQAGHYRIGTVYQFAREEGGWDTSRARWGLAPITRIPRDLPAGSQAVLDASSCLPAVNGYDRRGAWLLGVAHFYGGGDRRPNDAVTVAVALHEFFDIDDGIACPSHKRLAEALAWPNVPGGGWRRAQAAIRRLALDGWLVKNDARSVRHDPSKPDGRSTGLAMCMASPESWTRTLDRYGYHHNRSVRLLHDDRAGNDVLIRGYVAPEPRRSGSVAINVGAGQRTSKENEGEGERGEASPQRSLRGSQNIDPKVAQSQAEEKSGHASELEDPFGFAAEARRQ